MPMRVPNADVDAFLVSVGGLSVEQFGRVRDSANRIGAAVRVAARKPAKLSAAEVSALDKAVRDALVPLHEPLTAGGLGMLSMAVANTMSAARAITLRSLLSVEQYDALVGPFVEVGAAVPPHRAAGGVSPQGVFDHGGDAAPPNPARVTVARVNEAKLSSWAGPPPHRGMAWPPEGENPFDQRVDWPGRLYWAHEKPSRLFPAERMPMLEELGAGIPMGYTMLTLMERVALANGGSTRTWADEGPYAKTELQPYQLLVPPSADSYLVPAGRYLMLGASWPVKWAVQQAQTLSERTGGAVLVCRVLTMQNWH